MFCKQHVQIVSAKRPKIRQRHRMRGLGHKSTRSPASQISQFVSPLWPRHR